MPRRPHTRRAYASSDSDAIMASFSSFSPCSVVQSGFKSRLVGRKERGVRWVSFVRWKKGRECVVQCVVRSVVLESPTCSFCCCSCPCDWRRSATSGMGRRKCTCCMWGVKCDGRWKTSPQHSRPTNQHRWAYVSSFFLALAGAGITQTPPTKHMCSSCLCGREAPVEGLDAGHPLVDRLRVAPRLLDGPHLFWKKESLDGGMDERGGILVAVFLVCVLPICPRADQRRSRRRHLGGHRYTKQQTHHPPTDARVKPCVFPHAPSPPAPWRTLCGRGRAGAAPERWGPTAAGPARPGPA